MRRLATAALAVAVAAAGCGGSGKPSGAPGTPARGTHGDRPAGPQAQLQALLDRRARALQRGDVRAYAATATGPQRARDRRAARNARALPLRAVGLRATRVQVKGRRAMLDVRAGYGIRGIAGRFDAERTMRAVRTAHGWRIRAQGGRRQELPWEVAPFAAHRTEHFVVLAPEDLVTFGLDTALDDGYALMRRALQPGRLRRRYLVVVAADALQARRMTAGIRGVATLAAISDTAVHEEGPAERVARVYSQRLVIVWPSFAPLDADGRMRVVAHELTHAALAGQTSGRTPAWLVEGAALYVSGDRRVAEAAQLIAGAAGAARRFLTLTGLSRPDAIGRLGGEQQTAAYAYASSAAFYLTARYGSRRFFRLYDAFNRESLPGPAGPELTDRALRRTLGISLLGLERNLRRWIVTRAVVSPLSP